MTVAGTSQQETGVERATPTTAPQTRHGRPS